MSEPAAAPEPQEPQADVQQPGTTTEGVKKPDFQLFQEQYNQARDVGRKQAFKEVSEKLGVGSVDDLFRMAEQAEKDKEQDDKLASEYKSELDKLRKDFEELQSRHNQSSIDANISQAMAEYRPRPMALAAFKQSFNVQLGDAGMTIKEQGKEIPFSADGKQAADLAAAMKHFAEQPANHYLFESMSNLGGSPLQGRGSSNNQYDGSKLQDPKFVQALKMTNQFDNFMHEKPISADDWKRIEQYYKG